MRRGFADTSEGQIFYVSEGAGDPVILLHPSPHSWTHFIDCLPIIGRTHQTIAIDTIGYGDSDRPREPFTTMEQYASVVAEVIVALGLERASLLGHMTGAQIAAEVAARHPERVDKLVLSEVFNWNSPARAKFHEERHRFETPSMDGSHVRAIWDRFSTRLGYLGQDWVDRLFYNVYRVNRGEQPSEYGSMGWDGAAPWVMCRTELWDRTPLITAPTLIFHSENSDLGRAQPRLLETIRRSRAERYPAPGMNGPLENPVPWSEAIVSFLKDPGV